MAIVLLYLGTSLRTVVVIVLPYLGTSLRTVVVIVLPYLGTSHVAVNQLQLPPADQNISLLACLLVSYLVLSLAPFKLSNPAVVTGRLQGLKALVYIV